MNMPFSGTPPPVSPGRSILPMSDVTRDKTQRLLPVMYREGGVQQIRRAPSEHSITGGSPITSPRNAYRTGHPYEPPPGWTPAREEADQMAPRVESDPDRLEEILHPHGGNTETIEFLRGLSDGFVQPEAIKNTMAWRRKSIGEALGTIVSVPPSPETPEADAQNPSSILPLKNRVKGNLKKNSSFENLGPGEIPTPSMGFAAGSDGVWDERREVVARARRASAGMIEEEEAPGPPRRVMPLTSGATQRRMLAKVGAHSTRSVGGMSRGSTQRKMSVGYSDTGSSRLSMELRLQLGLVRVKSTYEEGEDDADKASLPMRANMMAARLYEKAADLRRDHGGKLEFAAYCAFFFLFTYVALGANPGETMLEQNRSVRNAVAEQEIFFEDYAVRKVYKDIDSIPDFWKWVSGPFIHTVLRPDFPDQPGTFYKYFRILGGIRIRQVRVKEGACEIPSAMEGFADVCFAPFSKKNEDKEDFGPLNLETGRKEWHWASKEAMGEGVYTGRTWIDFPGSGYNVTIPLDLNEARKTIAHLRENNWLDLQTRAIFIDLFVYNANTNLVTLVKMITEIPAAGAAIPFLLLRTAPLNTLNAKLARPSETFAETLIFAQVMFYMVAEIGFIMKDGWKYWKNGWNYLDWINYMAFCLAFYLRFVPYVETLRLEFPPKPGAFVNYEPAMWAVIQWKNVIAFNTLITTFRIFKYLRHVPFMRLLLKTIATASTQVSAFLMMFAVVFLGFTLGFNLAFGGEMAEYRNFMTTMFSLYRSLLGKDDFDRMRDVNRLLGPLLYFLWTMIGYFILLNMFIAILNDAIMQVKGDVAKATMSQTFDQVAAVVKAFIDRRLEVDDRPRQLATARQRLKEMRKMKRPNEAQQLLKECLGMRVTSLSEELKRGKAAEEGDSTNVDPDTRLQDLQARMAQAVGTLRRMKTGISSPTAHGGHGSLASLGLADSDGGMLSPKRKARVQRQMPSSNMAKPGHAKAKKLGLKWGTGGGGV